MAVKCLVISRTPEASTRVREALVREGVTFVTSADVGSGALLAKADLDDIDFGLVVPAPSVGNVHSPVLMLEAGIALGLGIPLGVVIAPGERPHPAWTGLRVLGGDDEETLRLHVRLFLGSRDLGDEPGRAPLAPTSLGEAKAQAFLDRLAAARRLDADVRGFTVEATVFDLLTEAGAIVERAARAGPRTADGAFVIPGEEDRLGYVVVEVKAGKQLSPRLINKAQLQLQEFLLRTNSGIGLLLWDSERPVSAIQVTPLVIALPLERFVADLATTSLATLLLKARNEAIHAL